MSSDKDLQVIGIYFANEMVNDTSLSAAAITVCDRIKQNLGFSVLLQLLQTETLERPENCFKWHEGERKDFKKLSFKLDPGTQLELQTQILNEEEKNSVDFEDWLALGCSVDWIK